MPASQECEKLDLEEQEAVNVFVKRSGVTYGVVNVYIHVKNARADRVEISARRDVVQKFAGERQKPDSIGGV